MKDKKIFYLTQGAIIAALYIVINYMQELIFPASTSFAVQFRLAELLMIFNLFTPAAIPGVTIGTLIANIINIQALPLDMLFGTVATFLAAYFMYLLRNVKWFSLPVLASLMPAICNGILIGIELEIFIIGNSFHIESFLIQASLVALGELAICTVLGLPLYKLLSGFDFFKNLNQSSRHF